MPRRWFQIHLSTCIVLMCVAATILSANMTVKSTGSRDNLHYYSDDKYSTFGWPVEACASINRYFIVEQTEETVNEIAWNGVILNSLIGIGTVLA